MRRYNQLCNCSITPANAAFTLRSGDFAAAKDTTWIADANSLLTRCVISRSNTSEVEYVDDAMALKTLSRL